MVCGSRGISDAPWIFYQINICTQENNLQDLILVEGDAKGVDRISGYWAKRHNVPIELYPADWNKYGKSAGYIRNEIMVKACDFCLILWDGKSKGTKHDIDLCKKLGKPYKLEIYNK